jgi:hypothetical protein
MKSKMMIAGATFAAAVMSFTGAQAGNPITSSLTAHWFEVADGSDNDFNHDGITPIVALGSGLTNGMPTVTSGVSDVGPSDELAWWSHALNANVVETLGGPATIQLPYDHDMFAPYSTGSNNSSFFETAYFTGNFGMATAGTASFTLGSDDDSFLYIDGVLVGQNPGIHADSTVNFDVNLGQGQHSIELFYADRQNVAAHLTLDSNVTLMPGVPEPATWGMMLLGFFGLGAIIRRRSPSATAVA